jgi:hypothetical protein
VFKLFPLAEYIEFHSLDNTSCRPTIYQNQITLKTDDKTLDAWKGGGKSFGHNLGGFGKPTLLISSGRSASASDRSSLVSQRHPAW